MPHINSTTPADEAVVTLMPSEVLMDFKGDIYLTRVSITHALNGTFSFVVE